MTYKQLKKALEEQGYSDIVLFKEPSYASAFIGVSSTDRAVYDFDLMVDFLVKYKHMTPIEAADFIDYDTKFALSSCVDSPIIVEKLK